MFQECRHIMPSGAKCKSPALRDQPFCYFHNSLHRLRKAPARVANEPLEIPELEDASAIQIGLNQVLAALGSSRLDPRRAWLYLHAFQIAAKIASRSSTDRSVYPPVRSLCYEADGETLAPEQTTCELPEDCAKCPKTANCETYKDYFEDEDEED